MNVHIILRLRATEATSADLRIGPLSGEVPRGWVPVWSMMRSSRLRLSSASVFKTLRPGSQGQVLTILSQVLTHYDRVPSAHMDREIPTLHITTPLGPSPLKSRVSVRRLAVRTPSPPTKSFPIKSPWVKLSGRPPIKFNGHENSHPLESRVCLSQTLWNRNSE